MIYTKTYGRFGAYLEATGPAGYELHDGMIETAMDHCAGHIDRDELVSFIMDSGYTKSEAMALAQESVDYVSTDDWS